MINVATFLDSIDRARDRRTDKEISRAAGLTGNAVAQMRAGKVPSLERAARVADVVGLELCLRRKGEPIDLFALHLCVLQAFMFAPGSGGAKEAETLISLVASSYERWSKVFLSVPPDQRQTVFDLSEKALLEAGERLSARVESDNADQGGGETADSENESSS